VSLQSTRSSLFRAQQFYNSEVKPEMVGHYTGEFSPTYMPVNHGKPGLGGVARYM
jgi:small subunit ribosomal protein S15e